MLFRSDHFTPRDVVKLLVSFVFGGDKENLLGDGKIRSVFDPCCGTGGMLTIGKEWIHENINSKLKVELYGQELNDTTYSICKSDLLLLGENPENIHGPCSSISDDRLQGQKFDYMITNPPFGVSWKSEEEFVVNESKDPNGRFVGGIPRTSDGSLLFLQHLIKKMEPRGSRIGIVFNGSPLFNGDAGSGESEIRKWIIENDWLECIVSLPEKVFFNTGIPTYFLILTNKKELRRKGKIQIIDGKDFHKPLKKNLGEKNREVTDQNVKDLFDLYINFKESEISKIYPNEHFGYLKLTVETPLFKNGKVEIDRTGKIKPDSKKRDFEKVPLGTSIKEYWEKEIIPYQKDSWIDESSIKTGYEISFNKEFYKFSEPRDTEVIKSDLEDLNEIIQKIIKEL